MPASILLILSDVPPSAHNIVYAPVPPSIFRLLIAPSFVPGQVSRVISGSVDIESGSFMFATATSEQLFSSVTVTV